ncbi:MFS transporter [Reyranella sp.]|uniref:MFS transporter n=1 Tax=Reyranella sp. TaxID=1929291 RepID=UPI0012154D9D|nr:MFS transporter [Reyranella sp.]TAJ90073.1 MAG: MFS transporter [Reyranella sp.]
MLGETEDGSRSPAISNLYLALGVMTVQQTFATMGRSTVPLIAAAIVADLDVDPALVGVYLAIGSVAAFLTTMGCGGFILRYGALRMTQVGMLALGVGLAVVVSGWLILFAVGAFIGGLGQALSTPSSSHLLGRLSPKHLAPLVFSIKQTGVPVGLMLAGVVAPVLATEAGWRMALLVVAGICALTVIALQPLRGRFDTDRNPNQPLSPADIRANVAGVLRNPALRALCLAMFSFVGLQTLFTGFFVLYLVRGLGYDLERAGFVFAIAVAVAVPARIGWGWLASRFVKPATLLAFLGIGMAVAAALTASIDPAWPTWVAAVIATLLSVSAVSWHGVLLAEVARLSPPGRIGATTGAVLAFGDAGALLLPLLFSAALTLTGGYSTGFLIGGGLALIVGGLGLRQRVRASIPS